MVWLPPIPKTRKELQNAIATERNKYRDALEKIAKARIEPGYAYQQALMLQEIANKSLEVK